MDKQINPEFLFFGLSSAYFIYSIIIDVKVHNLINNVNKLQKNFKKLSKNMNKKRR